MKSFKDLLEAKFVASADFKISPSGRKVHKMKKIADDPEDDDDKKDVKEGAVPAHMQGKQKPYVSSDGKGNFEVLGNKGQTKATFSRKEHGKDAQKKAQAHLRSKYDEYMKEETALEEAVDKQEQRFLQLARLGLVDKSEVSKLRIALDQLKADKPLTVAQRGMLLGVMTDLISLVTGDDTIFNRVKMDVQRESVEDLDENTEALKKKAEASGVSLSTLKTVYKRGVAAWNSGHRPGTTPQQWGMARVNSYITKGKTYHTADKDLREGGERQSFDVQDIDEACWDTHKQVGMKKKGDKMVPNCVPKEEVQEDSRLDNKAYHKGVSDKTAQARVSHWKKMDKLSDRDPRAYEPAPGDATAETKPSKHTKKYHAMYGEDVEIVEEETIVLDEGYVSLAQQRAVWATRKDGGKGHPDYKKKVKKEETVPFEGPYTKVKDTVTDKSGAKHTPMSAARHLARLALQKQQQKKKLKEECDDCYEEIIEDFEVGGEQYLDEGYDELFEEIEYQGRKVTLNKPFAGDGKKKRYVYVKNEKGNVVKVGFGDPNMEIRRDDPERRANFRARHNCDNPGPKWKARYWSCKYWSTTPVSKM